MNKPYINKGYNVYKNGTFRRFVHGRNRNVRVNTARQEVGYATHMGEWRKGIDENGTKWFEYCTTIGVYIKFMETEHER